MYWNDTKPNNVRNFQYTKFSVSNLVLTDREFFQVHGQNRPVANLSIVDFLPLAARNAISKAAEYVTFGFSFHILVFFPLIEKFEHHYL